jgi:hypothetical protein
MEEKFLKELKAINKRLERMEKAHRVICIISTLIDVFDPRFETTGELIKQIKNLCNETLKGKR